MSGRKKERESQKSPSTAPVDATLDAPADASEQPRDPADPAPDASQDASSSSDAGPSSEHDPVIVGVGASAGGLAAYTELLGNLPDDTGMAFVLVSHLDPLHESAMPEILSRVAKIPVHAATDGARVEPNCAYVIPPNTRIDLVDGHLRITPRPSPRWPHLPIDHFFRSLANTMGSKAIGIVLSGTGSDGALGIEAIRAEGGITMAQDSASAQYASMPQNAVATGAVDVVRAPAEMADELVRIARHLATHPDTVRQSSADADFAAILGLVRTRTDVDFRQYKQSSVHRRVLRRMLFTQRETYAAYLAELEANPSETEALFHSLLIGVSSFFRDPEVFDALNEIGFPAMLADRGQPGAIRIWVPGCAGGEEAYSIAISLVEYLGEAASEWTIQVFGTDLSDAAVAKARAGLYPRAIAGDMSAERLRRFFVEEEGGYRISKSIRDLCVFARQDLTRDPPFSQMDLISCRNLLIYLEGGLQRRLFLAFHYALRPAGLLLLGTAESVGSASELFVPLDKRFALYRKLFQHSKWPPIEFFTPRVRIPPVPSRPAPALAPSTDEAVQHQADRLLLSTFMPASVVVDEAFRIVQFHGRTGSYLEHAPGAASLDLLRLARPELVPALRSALRRAGETHEAVRTDGVDVQEGSRTRRLDFEVIPFRVTGTATNAFIVLFSDSALPGPRTIPGPAAPAQRHRGRTKSDITRVESLAAELGVLKAHLQDVTEEHESVNEELRAANEEIQSSNEELQSTNEELETAKEELQSANEELSTVNDEMRQRNIELHSANADLSNVFSSIQLPVIIVGADLCIRRFTPAASEIMRVLPSDVGRSVSDIKLSVLDVDLDAIITHVMETLQAVERKVQDVRGRWWQLVARPYTTRERRIDGAVILFSDIDAIERETQRIEEARAFAESIVTTVHVPLLVLDAKLHIELANRAYGEMFRVTPSEIQGKSLAEIADSRWAIPALQRRLRQVLSEDEPFAGFEVAAEFPGVGRKVMVLSGKRLRRLGDGSPRVLLGMEDATEREQALTRVHFLATVSQRLSASLREPAVCEVAADAAVPAVADRCVVLLRRLDGRLERVGERSAGVEPGPEGDGQGREGTGSQHPHAASGPELPPHVSRVIERAVQTGRAEFVIDADPDRSGGSSAMAVPLLTQGEVIGAIVLIQDGSGRHFDTRDLEMADGFGERTAAAITNARLFAAEQGARDDAEHARREAEAANLVKTQFLATMSHELRTPLNAIQGYVQLLEMELRGPLTAQQRADVGRIRRSQEHLTDLITHVLEFARLEAGHVAMAITEVRVDEVLTAILEITEVQMDAHGLRFECHRCDPAVTVRGDRERVQQIVLNMLSNAMKFTRRGGRVTLSCDTTAGEVVLRVRDSGDGIAAEQFDAIFAPFVQLESGLTRRASGTGLGLTISREFARGMEGDLTVQSKVGDGSTFTLRLPRGPDARPRVRAGAAAIDRAAHSPDAGSPAGEAR